MGRRSVLASLALSGVLLGPGAALTIAHAAPPEAASGDEAERKAAAKAEVQAASAAFSAGDYQAAIDHYEAAIAILPAPKLHYNIGVCHQRLALEAEAAEERTRRRDLAVESYNRYLEQNPRADDRLEVAETIRELGGTPVTMPTLKPLFEGDETPAEPGDKTPAEPPAERPADVDDPPSGPSDPQPQPTPAKRPYPAHGRFGLMLAGGYSPTLNQASGIDAPGMFAIDLHGGGFLGPRRRFLLAAHTTLFSGATLRPDGFSFYGYSLGLLGQQTWILGREAALLSFGGVVALTGQGLSQREDVPPPLCRVDRDGAQIAGRTGGLVAPRFDLGVLLGLRRRAMLSLLVQPSFAVFGDGPIGEQCSAGETPWTTLGVRRRWQFQLWAGAGFSFRF